MLAEAAHQAGARLCRGVDVTSCVPSVSDGWPHGWHVEFGDGRRRHQLRTTFVIDATGRAASLARRQGANRIASDRLVGLAAVLPAHSVEDEHVGRTLVEATDDGWWYSALLPGSRLMAVYMTDADLLPRQRQSWPAFWQARLQQTRLTKEHARSFRLSSAQPPGPRVVAANSSRLDRMSGRGWLAVGDAALAFDPLSSQGMLQAMISGISAGETLHRYLAGEVAALGEYDNRAQRTLREYARLHAAYYGRERRWPQSVFWRRRHGAAAQSEHAQHVAVRRRTGDPLAEGSST